MLCLPCSPFVYREVFVARRPGGYHRPRPHSHLGHPRSSERDSRPVDLDLLEPICSPVSRQVNRTARLVGAPILSLIPSTSTCFCRLYTIHTASTHTSKADERPGPRIHYVTRRSASPTCHHRLLRVKNLA